MSELKAYIAPTADGTGLADYYLKSEADKVIAVLQEKLKEQTSIAEERWKEFSIYRTSYAEAVKELYEKNKELRHSKYKRCLAMHDYCLCELEFSFRDPCIERSIEGCVRWRKWANLWLELSKKFKEGK